jgi:hypothetical protein
MYMYISYPWSHPVFTLSLGLLSPPFQWYLQRNEILLNLNMKCWNSAFNAQGSKEIIVVVQVGATQIYVAMEALKKKVRQDETHFTTKIGGKTSLGPIYSAL